MKRPLLPLILLIALAVVLTRFVCIGGAAEDAVPLTGAIDKLARRAGLNYILDPRVAGASFGPGRLLPQPSVNVPWTNVSTPDALVALLKEHDLKLVTNFLTTVARIVLADSDTNPMNESRIVTNAGDVIPLVSMQQVPLTDALTKFATWAGLKLDFAPPFNSPAFDSQGSVSLRWQRLTARQGLAALLDNYGLELTENAATRTARIALRAKPDGATNEALISAPLNSSRPQNPPYEIVLDGETVEFKNAAAVSSRMTIRDLGMKEMIAPDLYHGLSVVWDGQEYPRDPKRTGAWNGPWAIRPKTAWSTAFSLSEFLVPAEVLGAGRHTLALKDAAATSNPLTVFIENSPPATEANTVELDNHGTTTTAPPVSLLEAVRIAGAFVAETNENIAGHYLASAQLQSDAGGALYWTVRWIPADPSLKGKGSWFDIRVTMDKTATLIHGK